MRAAISPGSYASTETQWQGMTCGQNSDGNRWTTSWWRDIATTTVGGPARRLARFLSLCRARSLHNATGAHAIRSSSNRAVRRLRADRLLLLWSCCGGRRRRLTGAARVPSLMASGASC